MSGTVAGQLGVATFVVAAHDVDATARKHSQESPTIVVSFVMLKKTHSLNFSGDALLHLELSPRLRNATSLVVTHTIGGRLYAAYLHHL